MSAIFGIIGPHSADDAQRMASTLQHRGADTTIRSFGDNITVGALGLHSERMIFATGEYVTVTDASLYNRDELAKMISGDSSQYISASNARLLHGLDIVTHPHRLNSINGDYAIASIDCSHGAVYFARDFFGCHPLYVCSLNGSGVAFASEYKALLAVRRAPATVDRDMLQYLQCAKRLPVGRTLLNEIQEAPPGALSSLDSRQMVLRYSIPPLETNVTVRDESEAIGLILRNLREALSVRIRDVDTIGLALSGGIDSIAVAFLLRDLRPNGIIHTFTSGTDKDDQEVITASKVARAINSVHHEIFTPPGLLKSELPLLVWHLEDPFSRSEAIQLFEVGRAASGVVEVLFSAQGADGLFAGMPKYRLLWLANQFPWLRRGFEEFFTLTQFGIKPVSPIGKLFDYLRYGGKVPTVPTVTGAAMPVPTGFPEPGPELVNRGTSRGFQAGVCQDIHKFERGFAAFGLGYRSPFYDLRLVRSAYTITDRLKITRKVQKYIFRKAMTRIVSDEFRQIPKFPQRMRYDLEFANVLDEVGKDLVLSSLARRGLFDEQSLERLFRTSRDSVYRDEAAMRIWTAINTEIWFRSFVDPAKDFEANIAERAAQRAWNSGGSTCPGNTKPEQAR